MLKEVIREWLQLIDMGPAADTIILIAISFIYMIAGRGKPLGVRILKSSHGVLFALALIYAVFVSRYTYFGYEGWLDLPWGALLILGILSTIYSFWGLVKAWYFHVLHIFTLSYAMLATYHGAFIAAHIPP